ncbi:anthranilate synthase component I [Fischerella thermalis]|uniref:anthranilate synthase component I n=3 Tax=Fischerella thermalis TaxID=372787 RepID=UPI000C7F86DF|nr:anthranilate synthase component I [Fischerella thermalis]PLZ14198.1 anthranilate synthase component I [Fischerella thermalis WC114]PLZ20205.1 anthranilate synthase component I [Fischerella thermalis WC157]RDH48500.1 anthranilate synthase component I [Fischerella thermalis 111/344/542]
MTQPWYWRSLPLENRTGSHVFTALFGSAQTSGIATLLESPYPTPTDNPQLARYSICAGTPRYVDGHLQMWTPTLGNVLPFLEQLLQKKVGGVRGQGGRLGGQGRQGGENTFHTPHTPHTPPTAPNPHSPKRVGDPSSPPPHLPFRGGWLGWLGYDIAREIEQLPYTKSDSLPFPVAFWYEPDSFAVLDHWDQILWLAASSSDGLDELERKLEQENDGEMEKIHPTTPPPHQPILPTLRFYSSQEEYEAAVNSAKKYIQAGDIFQTNLSLRFETQTTASGWEIYRALQQINPSPFACYFQTPWGEVISCSPERLVKSQRHTDTKFHVSTRPIAGTRSRGIIPEQDQKLAEDLLNNTKERAEHIMLVDLERNDLGRVCEWGSVKVDELLTIERYSHVMHLVSNIIGILRDDISAVDLIRAVFPGGTITGCPKVRCMEIIEELEPVRRSLFYGSCGYLDWQGNLDLNILIRTLLLVPSNSGVGGVRGVEENTSRTPPTPHTPHTSHTSPTPSLNTVWGQVGAGVVADSDPEREWHESLHKAQAQLQALATVFGDRGMGKGAREMG